MIKINRVKLVLFLKTWFLLRCSSGTTQPIFFKGVMHDILSPEGSCKRSGIFMNLSWRQVTNHPLGAPVAIEGFPTSSSSLVGFLKLSGFTKA